MEKREIIKNFLDKNLQIDLSALEYFLDNQNKLEIFFDTIKDKKLTSQIITREIVEKIFSPTSTNINILKNFSESEEESISISNQIKLLNEKYDKISTILLQKTDLVNPISINKINNKIKKFSLIVMIREKDEEEKTFLIEDKTGTITVSLPNEEDFSSVDEDDVIGMILESQNNEYVCPKIIWPDIPLKMDFAHTKEEINCIFISNTTNSEKFIDWLKKNNEKKLIVFTHGKADDLEKITGDIPKTVVVTSTQNLPKIHQTKIVKIPENTILNIDGINIMLIQKKWIDSLQKISENENFKNVIVKILKKRFVGGKIDYLQKNLIKNFFIELVPDIICVTGSKTSEDFNYKNTTILTISDQDTQQCFYLINLKTRESIKVNLT